jgi:hypothetical protein
VKLLQYTADWFLARWAGFFLKKIVPVLGPSRHFVEYLSKASCYVLADPESILNVTCDRFPPSRIIPTGNEADSGAALLG